MNVMSNIIMNTLEMFSFFHYSSLVAHTFCTAFHCIMQFECQHGNLLKRSVNISTADVKDVN